ncbi:MAG TPA: competence/damage-inducible protein A [Actinomycetota bacterium]|jgi:nicotinamide-nucleotide amidase|nr:competence/damage-inducible protein A [Actinomycetota bacterium]
MRAEVVGIGTEILLGQIVNSNAAEISARLADIGIDVLHHQAVGDNVGRIAEAIRLALSRADVVMLTGGLGPTGDDVTRDGMAESLGRPLRRHAEIEEFLREKFRRLGRDMPESNLVQCDVPEGARYVLPDRGTAPGLVLELDGGKRLYAVAGVPAEMREMLEGTIVPELSALAGEGAIVSRVVRVVGMAEASVGELLDDLFRGSANPTVAYLASEGEVRVRVTAKASTREEAVALIDPVAREVRSRLGDRVVGVDDETLEAAVGRLLVQSKLTVACAESLTGGGLASRLADAPGASAYLAGAVVAYAPGAKREVLGVSEETLSRDGVVSEACAVEMARGVRRIFGADVGVSTTGVAGPDELEGHPPGELWVAVASERGEEARQFRAPGDRAQVRRWAQVQALDLLRKHLLRAPAARESG